MDNLITEFWKIKRYSVVKAGAAMMFLSVFMSYFFSTASTSVGWDFGYFVHQVIQQNCTYFFPVVMMLTASFIISRETVDDTLKSILTVPVTYKKLLIGKFELLFFLSIAFSLINAVLTVGMNLLLQFPGMTVYSMVIATGRIIAANLLVYLSVLPLMIANTFLFGSSLAGAAAAFVYGYLGTFEGSLLNWFPIKAAMILIDIKMRYLIQTLYTENWKKGRNKGFRHNEVYESPYLISGKSKTLNAGRIYLNPPHVGLNPF